MLNRWAYAVLHTTRVICMLICSSHVAQYADLGYNEVDGSEEWDNDYPNPITYIPPDQLTNNPGIVTTQFDNVLNAVRRCCRLALLFPSPGLEANLCSYLCNDVDTPAIDTILFSGPLHWQQHAEPLCHCLIMTVKQNCMLLQNWVTYSAGYNTTLAMIADNDVNGPYSLAVHNGEPPHALACH